MDAKNNVPCERIVKEALGETTARPLDLEGLFFVLKSEYYFGYILHLPLDIRLIWDYRLCCGHKYGNPMCGNPICVRISFYVYFTLFLSFLMI